MKAPSEFLSEKVPGGLKRDGIYEGRVFYFL